MLELFKINSVQIRSRNFKSVISLLTGSAISKGIFAVGGLVLAKYYGPSNYGVYSVFLSYIAILSLLSNLELNNIAIMQRDSRNVRNVFSASLWVILIITSTIVFVAYILKKSGIINLELSESVLILCGLGGVLSGWNLSQNALFTKYRLFRQISASFIIAAIFSVGFQTLFYILGQRENGLIYGWIVGLTAAFLYNLRVAKGRWNKVNIPSLIKSIRENINVVKYAYTATGINIIANNLLPILTLIYFTKPVVGVYAMAMRVLGVPIELISNSASKVYFPKAVTLFHSDKKQLYRLTRKLSSVSFVLILLFVILINTIGIYFLEMILPDPQWSGLKEYILILSLLPLSRSIINPISEVMVVIDKNEYSLIFNIYLLLVNLIAIYFGIMNHSFMICLYIFAISSALGYFIQWIVLMHDLRKLARHEE